MANLKDNNQKIVLNKNSQPIEQVSQIMPLQFNKGKI